MTPIDPIYVGHDAIDHLLHYVKDHRLSRFCLVADENTFPALGERVEAALKQAGHEITSIVLEGHHIHTNEHECMQVFVRAPLGPLTFIAVGSGTITDITRFVSHRTGRSFIGMPTAPSVDGFTSVGAPIIIAGVKTTILCQAPIAVFADLPTLANAPQRLIGAGFGDMIGKIASLADWRLGSILWDEPYDAAIAARSQSAIDSVIGHADAIGSHSEEGVRALMDALIESGLCMLDFGTSRPASGAEHHASHYWEMKRLQEGLPTPLHGQQVGYALTLIAEQYAKIRALSRTELMDRLESAVQPSREQEVALIREGYGEMADDVIKEHGAFLNLDEEGFDQLKRRIADRWDDIHAIACHVPPAEQIAEALRKAGAPATWQDLGLVAEEVQPGLRFGPYLRNRFTVLKLSRIINVPTE